MVTTWRYVLRLSIASFLVAGGMSCAFSDNQPCTREEAQAAEAVAATAKNWKQLHQQFERYGHCDDGAIAEGFSEAISLLLAERWNGIRGLEAIGASDPGFRKFVIRHIDETVPAERLARIKKNAATRCPSRLKILCRDIEVMAADKR